jgi:hypothetical protein
VSTHELRTVRRPVRDLISLYILEEINEAATFVTASCQFSQVFATSPENRRNPKSRSPAPQNFGGGQVMQQRLPFGFPR